MKVQLLRLARLLGVFALARRITRGRLRILCYHGIWIGPPPHYGDCLYMAAPVFAARMQWLADQGYRVLTLDDGLDRLAQGSLGSRDVVITIDDAWYGTWLHMLPVLRDHGFPSTLYVPTSDVMAQEPVLSALVHYLVQRAKARPDLCAALPGLRASRDDADLERSLVDWIAARPDAAARRQAVLDLAAALGLRADALFTDRVFGHMNRDELRAAAAMGVDIQLHTHTHSMHGMDPIAVRHEIDVNRGCLAELLGRPAATFRHFCYPSGEHHASIRTVLQAAGIDSATTTEPGLVAPGADRWAMSRVLDCQSMSLVELDARLSGLWSLLDGLRSRVRGRR